MSNHRQFNLQTYEIDNIISESVRICFKTQNFRIPGKTAEIYETDNFGNLTVVGFDF